MLRLIKKKNIPKLKYQISPVLSTTFSWSFSPSPKLKGTLNAAPTLLIIFRLAIMRSETTQPPIEEQIILTPFSLQPQPRHLKLHEFEESIVMLFLISLFLWAIFDFFSWEAIALALEQFMCTHYAASFIDKFQKIIFDRNVFFNYGVIFAYFFLVQGDWTGSQVYETFQDSNCIKFIRILE